MSRYNPNKAKVLHKVSRVNSENQYGDGIRLTYLPEHPSLRGLPDLSKEEKNLGGFAMPLSVGK